MFSIGNRNNITLTKGDLASFDCLITDMDNKVRVPVEGDELVFSIDGTDFSSNIEQSIHYYPRLLYRTIRRW